MKSTTYFGMIVLLSLPSVGICQEISPAEQEKYRNNAELAQQIAEKAQQTIRTKERAWKLKSTSGPGGECYNDVFTFREQRVKFSTCVYSSPDEASKLLVMQANGSSVAHYHPLEGFGDEAYYMSHQYFSWVGARRGRVLVMVHGPAGLTIPKRFARHALVEMDEK